MSKVNSFDVFDTALCRLVHSPEHLYLVAGRKLRNSGVLSLDDFEWLRARVTAEKKCRRRAPSGEVTLTEIYRELASMTNLSPSQTRFAMELELSEERRLVRPISQTHTQVQELQDTGANPLFLSDTYFTSETVDGLLKSVGYEGALDIVASSEELASKARGDLFEKIAVERSLNVSDILHVGDNIKSDVRNASAAGWKADLFNASHWSTLDRVLAASGQADFLASSIAGSARAARLGQEKPVHPGILTAASGVIGPLFTAYVLWVLRDVLARGKTAIYFVARDGYILAEICKILVKWMRVDVDVHYLYASRQSLLLPSLPEDRETLIDAALDLSGRYITHTTLEQALQGLRFDKDDIAAVCERAGLSGAVKISQLNEKQAEHLRSILNSADYLNPLLNRVRTARQAALDYFESTGLFDHPDASIVDLGWRGSMQVRLQSAIGDRTKLTGYYMGLHSIVLAPGQPRRVWHNMAWREALVEIFGAADHTSVRGYGTDSAGIPGCKPPVTEEPKLVPWGVREQHELVLRFATYFTSAIELEQFTLDEAYTALESAGLDAYNHFHRAPTPHEASAYGGAQHQADVNHKVYEDLAQPVTSLQMLGFLINKKARFKISNWYVGSLARSTDQFLPRLAAGLIRGYCYLRVRVASWRKKRSRHKQSNGAAMAPIANTVGSEFGK
ncbi:MAG: hypothetical protein AAFZ91_10960 [Pseudomonadota bacterium]